MSAILKESVHSGEMYHASMNKLNAQKAKIERNVSKLDNNSCA
jgi:hypothetical protein